MKTYAVQMEGVLDKMVSALLRRKKKESLTYRSTRGTTRNADFNNLVSGQGVHASGGK